MRSRRAKTEIDPSGVRTALQARTRPLQRRFAFAVAPELKRELRRARRRARTLTQAMAAADAATRTSAAGNATEAMRYAFPAPSMTRHGFLRGLHERLQPRTYLEIGVNLGSSLGVASCQTIGIDPAYRITAGISCPLRLYKTTSDEYFEAIDPRDNFGGLPVDLGFIDGMHLAEFAYRDFVNLERVSGPASVIFFDDMLPRSVSEAARDRHTRDWTGDVYKVAEVLRRLRPDLTVVSLNTAPTGTVVVLGLDPESEALATAYEEELEGLCAPDPQQVPRHVLERSSALDPQSVLNSELWPRLAELRDRGADAGEVREAIGASDLVATAPEVVRASPSS